MPLILPESHPSRGGSAAAPAGPPVRVGIVNIMPKLEAYEPLLLGPLGRVREWVEPVFLRLESHRYQSSDEHHLAQFYQTFDAALARGSLSGLIITGAPVEELPFEEVRYWGELTRILDYARKNVKSTLGLCWGGLALGGLLGIPKTLFPKKLFGVFDNRRLSSTHPLLLRQEATFPCAHSRHSGIKDAHLEEAASDGRVRLLSHSSETGYSLFETPEHRFVMHLGHPEYVAERLVFEWERDRAIQRPDVEPPHNFDSEHPVTSWHSHRESLFQSWVSLVATDDGSHGSPENSAFVILER